MVHNSCGSDADKLGRNLSREGRSVQQGEAAGHIVASNGTKRQWAITVKSREILQKYGVDISDAANGVPVGPTGPPQAA